MSQEEIKEEALKEEETKPEQPLSRFFRKYTIDGEVLVEQTADGKYAEFPLKTVDLSPLPEAFKPAHASEMALFHSLVVTIKKNRPNRVVPPTRTELLKSGADPKIVKRLVEFGLLTEEIVPLVKDDGTNPGSRACLYYTPQGRAYIRAKIDPNYALTEYM